MSDVSDFVRALWADKDAHEEQAAEGDPVWDYWADEAADRYEEDMFRD